jgi:hypothetical protein
MMLYLFGVYGLVVIAVFVPILLLYILTGLSWLVLRTIRLLTARIRAVLSLKYLVHTANWVNVAKIASTRKAV